MIQPGAAKGGSNKMKRAWIALVAVVALAVPLTATASVSQTDKENAAKACKTLRTGMGLAAFKQAYGTNHNRSNAFGKCVSKLARLEHENHSDAVKQCRAEQSANEAAFVAKYGTNKHGSNAFGKCVSQKQDQADQQDQDAIVNAAKQCRDERTANPTAFRDKYGTNHNKRNAFGKCVSKLAQEHENNS
jgi:hypothetical protein